MWRKWLAAGAIHGFVSVACGAFAAHGLKGSITEPMLANFETGARYQMYHALALIAVALLSRRNPSAAANAAGYCFALGTCVFSISLYVMALTGLKWLGAITPIGVAMLAGWVLLTVSARSAGSADAT